MVKMRVNNFSNGSQKGNSKVSVKTEIQKKKASEMKKTEKVVQTYNTWGKIWYLVKNFEYIMTLFSITATYFLTTGIQFWISDYWNIILG